MLEMHLLWRNDVHDDFVSWTSSLLFALQRAIYAVKMGDKDSNISICILDTWKMGTEMFYHAETLLGLYSVPNEGKLQHRYYTAEFLSIGTLNLSPGHGSDVVSFSEMVDFGLYDLVPHLRPACGKAQLWIPVSNIRAMYFTIPTPISEQDIHIATRLAQFMCPSLVLPFFTNLLSLQKRNAEDELFKAGWKALIGKLPKTSRNQVYLLTRVEQGAGGAFVREDPALRNAVDEDVIEFAKMWKAGQKAEAPVGNNLADMLSNMSSKLSFKFGIQ